jgi:phage tail-like protein
VTVRGAVPDLLSAIPIGLQLPAAYQDDEFALRFVEAFDAGLAPIIATLDDLPAYFEPGLTPDDFLEWLATWVAAALDDASTPAARRRIVARAVALHRRRGTVAALAEALEVAVGGGAVVRVVESGAATWSRTPVAALPGSADARLDVRIAVDDPARVDVRHVDALVAAMKPAHVVYTVEVVSR